VIRYITLGEALEVHARIMAQSGGIATLLSIGALESALAQPRMTFGGEELYPTLVEKAAALGFALIQNHPFVDGNKRTGHALMEVFLLLNGYEIQATVDEQEDVILRVASGSMPRGDFTAWLRLHVRPCR
jgi:death-on-curing protein